MQIFCYGWSWLSAVDAYKCANMCTSFFFSSPFSIAGAVLAGEWNWRSAGELSLCLQSEFWLTLLSAEIKNVLLDPVAEMLPASFSEFLEFWKKRKKISVVRFTGKTVLFSIMFLFC